MIKEFPDKPLTLSLVVPVFNEVEAITFFLNRVTKVIKQMELINSEFIFVNDGSSDKTLQCLLVQQIKDTRIKIVDLSRNFGKEAALSAGLQISTGQVVIPIDVDLQDPPELIPEMIAKWREGYDVVLARRINRESDGWAKRISANWFYRIHNKVTTHQLPASVGDFRLLDKCVVEALRQLPESTRFMKGLFAWVGFRTTYVEYSRPKRKAGITKFNGWKLWNFALDGITSFSTAPLRIWLYLGLLVSFMALLYILFILVRVLFFGVDVPGYASLIITITFLGGLQLIGIGVIGEYLGRTYIESKRRPIFLIRHIYQVKG
jgi:glycosyltransferase involved in cell wall biosynthesis